MQSPAPVAKKIAGRSKDSSGDSSKSDIIENIEAVTDLEEDKKKKAADDQSDSSATNITEDMVPETDGGSIKKAVGEGSQLPTGIDSEVGVLDDDSSSSNSSSTGSSS